MHWKYHTRASHLHPAIESLKVVISQGPHLNLLKRKTCKFGDLQDPDCQWKGLPQHPSSFYLGMPKTKKIANQYSVIK
jgi:hypothetical protein